MQTFKACSDHPSDEEQDEPIPFSIHSDSILPSQKVQQISQVTSSHFPLLLDQIMTPFLERSIYIS